MSGKNREDPSKKAAIRILSILGLLILLFCGYMTFRRTVTRFSMDYFYPVLKGMRATEGLAAKNALLLESRNTLIGLVDRLQRENIVLRAQTAQLAQILQENRKMRHLLGLNAPRSYKPVFAEVLLRDPASWRENFTVDKGADSGIRPGDLVCSMYFPANGKAPMNAVVGRVTTVSRRSAAVATLLHRECQIAVVLPESNAYGVLRGSAGGDGTVYLTNLPVKGRFGAGEIVMTSPYGTRTPSGMYVGTLQPYPDGTVARTASNRLSAESRILPAVDFENLRFVAIMTELSPPSGEGRSR